MRTSVKHSSRMSALPAQRTFDFACLEVAPALVAGVVALSHVDFGSAVLVAAGVFTTSWALGRGSFPLHLMPLGGALARGLAVFTGVVGAWLVSLTLDPLNAAQLIVPLLSAWLMLGFGLGLTSSLEPKLAVRVAVIGSPQLAEALGAELELLELKRWEVIGWIDFTDDGLPGTDGSPPALGFAASIESIVAEHDIDLLVFGVRESERHAGEWLGVDSITALERVVQVCVDLDLRVIGADQFFEQNFGHVPLAAINAAWFQYVIHPRFHATPPGRKRVYDFFFSLVIAVLLTPLFLLAMLTVKLFGGPGPVFHVQRRVGEGGEEFTLRKLRTMRVDAEAEGTPQWSGSDDHRQTRIGRILRQTHIDEMPQLWNVVKGEMSVVGPRPERREFVQKLETELPFYDRRLMVKPGLTGWAQVSCGYAGSKAGTAWKLSFDLYYLKHRSPIFDLLIGVETIAVPLRDLRRPARGANALVLPQHLRETVPGFELPEQVPVPSPASAPAPAASNVNLAQARKR
jgi:lipopolysaccharide/colanic/teichoic acid biosynthesis glycosyltransferase